MPKTDHNAVIIPWWREGGVAMTYVMDATLTHPHYRGQKQVRIPGGGGKAGESTCQTATRELEEETGLIVDNEGDLVFIDEIWKGGHRKTAYLVSLESCSGELRKEVLHELDADLDPPRPASFSEAVRVVHQTRRNNFNHNALVRAHWKIERGSKG